MPYLEQLTSSYKVLILQIQNLSHRMLGIAAGHSTGHDDTPPANIPQIQLPPPKNDDELVRPKIDGSKHRKRTRSVSRATANEILRPQGKKACIPAKSTALTLRYYWEEFAEPSSDGSPTLRELDKMPQPSRKKEWRENAAGGHRNRQ